LSFPDRRDRLDSFGIQHRHAELVVAEAPFPELVKSSFRMLAVVKNTDQERRMVGCGHSRSSVEMSAGFQRHGTPASHSLPAAGKDAKTIPEGRKKELRLGQVWSM
jgi:hypothetical protein